MKSLVTLFAFTCKCTTFINTVSHSSVAKCAITYFYGLITSFITKISSFFLVFAFLFKDDSILYTLHSLSILYLNCNTILLWKIVRAHISHEKKPLCKATCSLTHIISRFDFELWPFFGRDASTFMLWWFLKYTSALTHHYR